MESPRIYYEDFCRFTRYKIDKKIKYAGHCRDEVYKENWKSNTAN